MLSFISLWFILFHSLFLLNKQLRFFSFLELLIFTCISSYPLLGFFALVFSSSSLLPFDLFISLPIVATLLFVFVFARSSDYLLFIGQLNTFVSQLFVRLSFYNVRERFFLFLLLSLLFFSSFGPITHPDAVNYHVGIAQQIISRDSFVFDNSFSLGLAGLGDFAHVAFLYENSSWLIRLINFIPLVLVTVFLILFSRQSKVVFFFLLSPVLIQWLTIGKSLFFSESLIAILYFLLTLSKPNIYKYFLFSLACFLGLSLRISSVLIIFPMYLHLSFLFFSSLFPVCFKFPTINKANFSFLILSLILILVSVSPFILRYIIYSNPLFPFFGTIFTPDDPSLIGFESGVKNLFSRDRFFPAYLVFPFSTRFVASILSFPSAFIILSSALQYFFNQKRTGFLSLVILFQVILLLFFGQDRPDFYSAPLILSCLIFSGSPFIRSFPTLIALIFQIFYSILLFSFSSFQSFLSIVNYSDYMKNNAYGFDLVRNVRLSTQGKILLLDFRTPRLYLDSNYVDRESFMRCVGTSPSDYTSLPFEQCLNRYSISAVVFQDIPSSFKYYASCNEFTFVVAHRNPFTRSFSSAHLCIF